MSKPTLVIGNKNYSSWSLRPWLAMKQLGLDFDEVRIALYTPESAAKIRSFSPSGKVPVLIHDSVTVWDSLAIFGYLAEQFPSLHWWPEERIARAVARSICAEMHSGFQHLRHSMPMNCRRRLPSKEITPQLQADIVRITSIWRECRQRFGSGGSLLFGEFTLADAMFAPVVTRFVTYGVQLDSVTRAYTEAILALPAMQEWLLAASLELETIPDFDL